MADTPIKSITSGYNVSKINDNFDNIQAKLDGPVLSSSDGQNTMYQDFDLNGYDLLNANTLNVQGLTIAGSAVTISNLGSLSPNTVGNIQIINGAVTDNKIVSISGSKASFQQVGAGATIKDLQTKAREQVSVFDFGALGDGVTDDTVAFQNACALGLPVYVSLTSSFYAITSLTNAQLALLWGPGLVKVSGTVTPINSSPSWATNDLAGINTVKPTLTPNQTPGVAGSVGNGAALYDINRTGGWGLYGSVLSKLHVTAAVPSSQFDVGMTSWVSHTNLTGGQSFGMWAGANTPAANLSETYSSGASVGFEVNVGNRWGNFGLQTDVGGTRYTVGIQNVPDVLPAKDGVNWVSVTNITIGAGATLTIPNHGLVANMGIVFDPGSGTLPTGIIAGQKYYVSASGLTTNTFQISSTIGGALITTSGSFVGPVRALPSWAGSFAMVTSASVWGHNWWVGHLNRYDTILGGGYVNLHNGASVATNAHNWTKLGGFWTKGLDFSGCNFASHCIDFQTVQRSGGYAINFDFNTQSTGTATAGSVPSPGNYQGFLIFGLSGGMIKIPYFQA